MYNTRYCLQENQGTAERRGVYDLCMLETREALPIELPEHYNRLVAAFSFLEHSTRSVIKSILSPCCSQRHLVPGLAQRVTTTYVLVQLFWMVASHGNVMYF